MKKETAKKVVAMLGLVAMLVAGGNVFAAKTVPTKAVDLNQAGVSELMTIPGIGASKAQAIVDFRNATPFASAEDIVKVKGIGDKMFAKIAQYVSVNGKAGTSQAAAQTTPGTAEKAVK